MKFLAALTFLALSSCTNDANICAKEHNDRYIRDEIVTHNVKITEIEGVTCHVAVYSDAVIVTTLDGEDKDWQVIYVDGDVVNSSCRIARDGTCFWHKYNFGCVHTYKTYQRIVFY